MSYDIFSAYGLDKIHDSFTENYDYKDAEPTQWKLVKTKEVTDSDGFLTEYSWYTNGEKHIFMFGDTDLYTPDEDYADWETDSSVTAEEWFDSYTGFESESDPWEHFEEDELDNTLNGNSDFMNDGFLNRYAEGTELED